MDAPAQSVEMKMRVPTFLKQPNGAVWLNPARKFARGTILAPQTGAFATSAKSGSNPGVSKTIILEGAQNAVSEVYALMGEHGSTDNADVQARLSCTLFDPAYRRQLMNRDILVNHVFGNYQLPGVLKETIALESQQNLTGLLYNNSTAGTSNYRLAAKALKIESSEETRSLVTDFANELRIRKTFCCPYWLTTDDAVSLAIGATRQRAFFTNTRSWTLILYNLMASVIVTAGGGGDTQELFSANIYDPGTERLLTIGNPSTYNMIAGGSAQLPYVFPWPIMMLPNTQGYFELTNLTTNRALEVFLTFNAVAVFDGEPLWAQQDIQASIPVAQEL